MQWWFNITRKIRFLIIGCFNAGVSYLIYALYCWVIGKDSYQSALAISWALSSIISFNLQKYLVFQSRGNYIKEYLKCCVSWSLSYFINAIVLEIFTRFFNVYLAQIFATACVAVVTYVLFKKFAFNLRCN